MMVVLYHYTFNGISNGKISALTHSNSLIEITRYGYLGVELFFMISGYVIFFSALNRTPSQFAVSRAVRLYPAYWFAVMFTSLFAYFWGGDLMSVEPKQIVWNMTMLQSFFWVPHVDGVYWTLLYEITFYFAVAVLLLFGMQKHLQALFLVWPFLILAASFFNLSEMVYLGEYYCYFAAGSVFAILRQNKKPIVWVSLILSLLLCLEFSVGQAALLTEHKGFYFSPWVIATVILTFFVVFLFQGTDKSQNIVLPYSKTLGALTYPVYLIHAHVGYMLINQFATEDNKWLVYIFVVSLVLLCSFLIHLLIEDKLKRLWQRGFELTLGNLLNRVQAFLQFMRQYIQPRLVKRP